MINIKKLFKSERGTGKTKVPVHRKSGVRMEYRRTGKKESPRSGTGKMDKFPESIKNEILAQRSYGESGAKIKDLINGKITHELVSSDLSPELRQNIDNIDNKIVNLRNKIRDESDPIKIKELRSKQDKLLEEGRKLAPTKEITYIDGKSTGRNLVEEGLINKAGELTITAQALTDWAKKQGIDSKKKRTSAADAEKVKHAETKKDLDRSDKKIAELEVRAKHNLDEIKMVQESKQDSDRIRQELGRDNRDLKDKLRACLGDKK